MISRRPRLWWGFGLGSAVLLGALGWASIAVYRLEARTAEQRALSQRQEVIRRALWRVDSQLAPIIAMEAARPPSSTAMRIDQRDAPQFDFADSDAEFHRMSVAQPAPNQFADGFFVIDPDGQVRASDEQTRIAASAVDKSDQANAGVLQTDDASDSVALSAQTAAAEPETESIQAEAQPEAGELTYDFAARQQVANLANSQQLAEPERASSPRRAAKGKPNAHRTEEALALALADQALETGLAGRMSADELMLELDESTPMSPAIGRINAVWAPLPSPDAEPELLLVREVETAAGARSQGVRLDWPGLRSMLEESVSDLLPTTTLIPARGDVLQTERAGRAYRLATIPALLVPGGAIAIEDERMTPAFWALLVTWVATLVALVAVASVLHATLRLSDRRARFVGAVTHELRTPLTTFRLYAQMLAGGMVTDESAKVEYLGTLERESIRLGEIVENVLEYARLTRRRPGDARPPGERSITPSELVARVRPVLSRRAEQSGMDLIVSIDATAEADSGQTATCDPRSVERILMNLVENACKYAAPSEDATDDDADTRIHLDVSAPARMLEILVADHGPGVPNRQRERVFGEFQRGPGAAESSRPGLGLGLALSRGLAREMGGDLRLVRRRGHGAEFLLTVPLDAGNPETPEN